MDSTTANARRPLEIEAALRIKTYDIDFSGVVSNIVFVRWLEDLRLRMLDAHLPLQRQLDRGYVPILTRTEIEYHLPLTLGQSPRGRMWVSQVGRSRWEVQAEILHEEELVASATQTGVYVDLVTRKPVGLPDELRLKFDGL